MKDASALIPDGLKGVNHPPAVEVVVARVTLAPLVGRSHYEVAEEAPVAEVETIVAQGGDGRDAVRARWAWVRDDESGE
ncbi:MAG: hypothetical protein ACR2G5_17060 [Pyrinomonadaceae bacterium]